MEYVNMGNRVLNNYILKTDLGYIVIDTGYAGDFNRFCKELKRNSINLEDIKYIVITHAHDDHAGYLNELKQATNATIVMDCSSPERLLLGQNVWDGGYSSRLAKGFAGLFSLFGKGAHRFPIVKSFEDTLLWDGETQFFEEKGISLKIISLPGHTKDSIGLLTSDGLLFCGDAAMNGFPSIHRNIIWIENLDDYKRSWETMLNCGAKMILPSHGKPFPVTDFEKYIGCLGKLRIHKP
jgi:glyoxylase-like metal-dependent hydrolase (beta-lactamase superfamily II)